MTVATIELQPELRHDVLIATRTHAQDLALAACLCAVGDPSDEACRIFSLAVQHAGRLYIPAGAKLLAPSGEFPLSGIDLKSRHIRMGRPDLVAAWVAKNGGTLGAEARRWLHASAAEDPSPVLIADEVGDLGIICLAQADSLDSPNLLGDETVHGLRRSLVESQSELRTREAHLLR